MGQQSPHSSDIRRQAAELFSTGFGYKSVASKLRISVTTSRVWRDKHAAGTLLGLGVMGNNTYPVELKVDAVEAFLAGLSTTEVVARFNISNRSIFNKWVAIYRVDGPAGLQPKPKGRRAKVVTIGPETLEEEVLRLRLEVAVLKKQEALMIEGDPRFWEKPPSSNH